MPSPPNPSEFMSKMIRFEVWAAFVDEESRMDQADAIGQMSLRLQEIGLLSPTLQKMIMSVQQGTCDRSELEYQLLCATPKIEGL